MLENKGQEYYSTHREEYKDYLRQEEQKRREQEKILNQIELTKLKSDYNDLEEQYASLKKQYYSCFALNIPLKAKISKQMNTIEDSMAQINSKIKFLSE